MSLINKNKKEKIKVTNVGTDVFNKDLKQQGLDSTQVEWKPVAGGKPELIAALDYLKEPQRYERIKKANAEVAKRIKEAHPVLIDYRPAIEVIPGMTKNTFLHAGPPITWEKMNGAMRGSVIAGIILENMATNAEEAEKLAASGAINFRPCHEFATVGSMAGITTPSMYVHVVKNITHGNLAFSVLSENASKVMRCGAHDEGVIKRLRWMAKVLGPMLSQAVRNSGGIDLRALLAQSIQMGDDDHNRNNAGSLLLIQALTPHILATDFSYEDKADAINFMNSHPYFSGPTWMTFCKSVMDSAHGVEDSTIVVTLNRNGTEFGVRVAHNKDFKWYTGPAQKVRGTYFAGYNDADAGLDIGDSAITETFGIGASVIPGAPMLARHFGSIKASMEYFSKLLEITTDRHPILTIPNVEHKGAPIGIDVMKVIEKQTLPTMTTGIAHKMAGIGMIGAGITNPPMEAFEKAILSLAKEIK